MATRTIANGGGNWSSTGTWVEGAVPVAGDAVVATGSSGQLTVDTASACSTMILTGYTNTLTFNSTLTLTSTCTFVSGMTVAGTAGTLIFTISGNTTFTTASKTLTCALTVANTGIATLTVSGNFTVNGLMTVDTTAALTGIDSATISCAGGFTQITPGTNNLQGSATITMTGGTFTAGSSTGSFVLNLKFDGNVTVSGTIQFGAGGARTITYTSGTITTTGSTLRFRGDSTLNTVGMKWGTINFAQFLTLTLSSAISCTNFNCSVGTVTLSGAGSMTADASTFGSGCILNVGNSAVIGGASGGVSAVGFAG